MSDWHTLNVQDTAASLHTAVDAGLDAAAVEKSRKEHGRNELVERGTKSPWAILAEQFKSLLVILLVVAAFVSGVILQEWIDCAVIMVIVVLNALLGFRQEFKAEKAMAALKELAKPHVRVKRDGQVQEIKSSELVPGDIVMLEAGNVIPADCRLGEAAELRVEEASLTGESVPVFKDAGAALDAQAALGDRVNMAYMGTAVTSGRGVGIVIATGMKTELGKIADRLQTVEKEDTPLQKQLDRLGKFLVIAALSLIALVALIGLSQGEPVKAIFMTAVSMAVAAVPEGLPAVVTIALALGAQRMLARKALIRKLPAVETLGAVTVICSDKTGTLTQNRMTVTMLVAPDGEADGQGEQGEAAQAPPKSDAMVPDYFKNHLTAALMLQGGSLCNDAVLQTNGDQANGANGSAYTALGDPTEGALVVAAAEAGLLKEDLEKALPRVGEAPFDSERKRMTTLHALPGGGAAPEAVNLFHALGDGATHVMCCKGATGSLLEVSTHVLSGGKVVPLTDETRRKIEGDNDALAGEGIRVLGMGFRMFDSLPETVSQETLEKDIIFVGMVGMLDPVRPEVCRAVGRCMSAGIRPVMITGDHPQMARYIAGQLGMIKDGAEQAAAAPDAGNHADGQSVLTSRDLLDMSPEDLRRAAAKVSVFARVAPEHKLNIVDALQENGDICAMTGDGVNDAPALKSADIGVAMGITGTDVSKEASDMVLEDDNFSTIVAAVEEGRTIFNNIRRFIRFLLSCNTGEIWVFLLAPLFGMPLPLLPVQILWMNLVTDGFPALGLGVEKAENDVMNRPPRNPKAPIIGKNQAIHILWIGLLIGLCALLLGYVEWNTTTATATTTADVSANAASEAGHGHGQHTASEWQTMIFCCMVFAQLFLAFAERSDGSSIFTIGIHTNPYVLVSVIGAVLLQLAIVYLPVGQHLFKTAALSAGQMGMCVGLGSLTLIAVEIEKLIKRGRKKSLIATDNKI